MWETKTKYHSNVIAVVYDHQEEQYIADRYKEIYSLPKHIQEDLQLWISHVCKKYWFEYSDVMSLTKYQLWQLILKNEMMTT